jgi:hypothetical protein
MNIYCNIGRLRDTAYFEYNAIVSYLYDNSYFMRRVSHFLRTLYLIVISIRYTTPR